MMLDEFREIDRRGRIDRPRLFEASRIDPPATAAELRAAEESLGIRLPPKFREFLQGFGGGSYGFITIFSATSKSEWYLPTKCREARAWLPAGVLPFSDDFAGGYYVFQVEDRQAREPVYYWNRDGGLKPTEFADALELIARYAYGPA